MKEFRKNEQGLFICEECNLEFNTSYALTRHIKNKHFDTKIYFDKFINENDENICLICNNPNKFVGLFHGYKKGCSEKCSNMIRYQHTSNTLLKLYNEDNPQKIKEIKIKTIESYRKNIKSINEKRNRTYENKFGSHPLANEKIKEQIKITNFEKYGCSYPLQNINIFEKNQKSAKKIHYYNENVYYRGSYELDFLEKFYNYIDIKNGSFIKYKLNKKDKIYFPDFYIPSLNLIVECKNSYLSKRDRKIILAKEKATIASGFKYIMIIDKNYDKFVEIIKKENENILTNQVLD